MANNGKGLDPAVSVQGPATVGALELQVEGGSSGYPAGQACNGNRSAYAYHSEKVRMGTAMDERGILSMTMEQLRIYAKELTHTHLALLQETSRKEKQGDKLVNILYSLAKHGPTEKPMLTATSFEVSLIRSTSNSNDKMNSSRYRGGGSISGKENCNGCAPPDRAPKQCSSQTLSETGKASGTVNNSDLSEFNYGGNNAEKQDWSSDFVSPSSSSSESVDSALACDVVDVAALVRPISATPSPSAPSSGVQKTILTDKENEVISKVKLLPAPFDALKQQKMDDKKTINGFYRDPAIKVQETRRSTPSSEHSNVQKVVPSPVLASLAGSTKTKTSVNHKRPAAKYYEPPHKREGMKNQLPQKSASGSGQSEASRNLVRYQPIVRQLQIEFAIGKDGRHGAGVLVINQMRMRTVYYTYCKPFTAGMMAPAEGRSSRKIRNCADGLRYFQKYFRCGDHIRVYCDDDRFGDETFKPTRNLTDQVEKISREFGCNIELFQRPINSSATLQENKQMLAAVHLASGRRQKCIDILESLIGATPAAPGT